MKKEDNPKILFEYLDDKYTEWKLSPNQKKKEFIENCVLQYLENMDDQFYCEISEGAASGLCSFPYFEEDLKKILSFLENRIE